MRWKIHEHGRLNEAVKMPSGNEPGFVDADTHVDECEVTRLYLPKSMEHIRSGTMTLLEGQEPSYLCPLKRRMWFIDGRIVVRP